MSAALGVLLSGRTINFDPSVSKSARTRNHLSTGEQLTPRTYDAEANDKAEEDRTQNNFGILIHMNQLKIRLAMANEGNACDIDCNHRGADKKQP